MNIVQKKALLVGLTSVLGFWISAFLHLTDPFWMLMTIVILLSEPTLHPFLKGMMRAGGRLVGLIVGLLMLHFVINDIFLLSFFLITVITFSNYLGFQSPYQYSYFYASLTFYLVFIIAAMMPDQLESFIIWRGAEILIGVILASLASMLLPYQHQLPQRKLSHPLQRSFKIALNAHLSFIICVWLGWYGAIPGIVSAYVVTADVSHQGARQKAIQRLFGCLLGGSIALSYLSFIEQTSLSISLCIFITLTTLIYMRHTSSKYGYVYLQAAIAFCISVITSGSGQVTNLTPALERLAGIILGCSVSLILNYLVFPAVHQNDP